jgi:hypothetical protein
MRIPQLRDYLKTIRRDVSVLIIGPPGIGKSVCIREVAEEEAREMNLKFVDYDDSYFNEIMKNPQDYYVFVDIRLSEVEPSDLIGIPRDLDSCIAYKPLTWATVLSKAKSGMLLLDEFTNIQRLDILSAAYKIVLDRKAGFVKFSDNVRIVALGNSPEHSIVARKLPTPLMSRFHVVEVDAPKIEEWAGWMDAHYKNWDRRVLAYLTRFPEDFIALPSDAETLENYPTPRTWTNLALELKDTPTQFLREKIYGYVGKAVGGKLYAFITTPTPEPEELLNNPNMFKELGLDAKYLAIISVAEYYKRNEAKRELAKKVLDFLDVVANVQQDFIMLFLIALGDKRMKFYHYVLENRQSRTWMALREVGNYIALSMVEAH